MEQNIIMIILLGILGLITGSFVGASVWRLRARQLRLDAKSGDKVPENDKKEVAKLTRKSLHKDRSVCLHCGHTLQWYDLVPLVSWLSLRGKCRYCHKSIGRFEPLIEVGTALFFVLSYIYWPVSLVSTMDIAHFVIWLVAGVGLTVLFVYDAKWFLLPNVIVFPLIGLGLVNSGITVVESQFSWFTVSSILSGCAVLSGLYYLIYFFSRRQWVGFGDVKLGLALALLLADWQLSMLALFLANFFGTIIFLPFMLNGKVKRDTHIPFGPLLIAGWFVSGLFGAYILVWYLRLTLGVL